jgi:hypothetical protein
VFFGGKGISLVLEHVKRINDTGAGLCRVNHIVQVTAAGGDVRIGKFFLVVLGQFQPGLLRVFRFGNLLSIYLLTAPSGPITAISAEGQARLMSELRCLLLITM